MDYTPTKRIFHGEYPRRPEPTYGFDGTLLPVDLACRDTLHELPCEHTANEFLRTWVEYCSTNFEAVDTAWMEADRMGLADELVELGGFEVKEGEIVDADLWGPYAPEGDGLDDIEF